MKRLAALLIPLGLVAWAPPAAGEHTEDFVVQGRVLVGNPETRVAGGVTELVSPCMDTADPAIPPGAAQGIDGFWIQLPLDPDTGLSPLAGHTATLVAEEPNDFDAWFYTEGCQLITPSADPDAYSMASTDLVSSDGSVEQGRIPLAAAWVAVDLWRGASASFTFSVPVAASPS